MASLVAHFIIRISGFIHPHEKVIQGHNDLKKWINKNTANISTSRKFCSSDRKKGMGVRGKKGEQTEWWRADEWVEVEKWKKNDYVSPVGGIQWDHYYSLN